ncbi:ribosomal RNA processing protein 1 homolog B [Cottoperca gobio]|uniref:Ribosomal RNA processing protein 1 homolog B n=1 Tax=Cottoperca gobio TaxID=56716 RepID=A0A6J2RYL5_COTGO|nr:ribosomal RNA processing protein 1 homolog B [Cottoperca gobio]
MAAIQEPEVQLAQRLASNEKPIRTKAIKKLRKYINVRSHHSTSGFTVDELLKLWKGLFYCLWMQDKPQLQEELSNQISTLIHSFHNIDGQLLYLESFLQTFKREWTGIDRLRMDKFFQLVRFMFRQTFEMLKRKNWDSCVVGRFLELLTAQLLQSSSAAPIGLQFHILDIYMTELAAVGSAELTADQNLIFIEPFCKTAAKTKDRSLFSAICNSILSTIIDQAPFAIEDLMKEVKAAEASDSDSGQASEEDERDDELKEKMIKPVGEKGTWKQINGNEEKDDDDEDDDEEDDDEDDDDADELLHLEDSDTEESCDEDVGPVLQFAYAALADKLFELASRSSTPSQNRQRLYKIIRVLRDLNEGIFPQDEYPEEVSTDEDDDMFGSRKRMKRGRGHVEDEGVPAAKKSKGREASTLKKPNKEPGKDDNDPADVTAHNENKTKKKRKRKKKRKAGQGGSAGVEENADGSEKEQTVAQAQRTSEEIDSLSSVKVTEAATPEDQSETLLLSEVQKQPAVTVTEETSRPTPCTTDEDQSEKFSNKKKKEETSELKADVTQVAEDQQTVGAESERSSETAATVSGEKKKKKKRKKRKSLKAVFHSDEIVAVSQVNAEAEIIPVSSEESAERNETTPPETDAPPAKKEKKGLMAKKHLKEDEGNAVSTEADFPSKCCEDSKEDGPTTELDKPDDSTTPFKKRSKKKNLKAEAPKVETEAQLETKGKQTDAEVPSIDEEASQDATAVPLKKKKKGKQEDVSPAADESTITPLKKKRKKTQKELKTTVEEETSTETPQAVDAEFKITMTTPAKKKKKKSAAAQVDKKDETQLQMDCCFDELPLDETEVVSSSEKPSKKKKKRKIPVVFEYEADELEAAAQEATSINGFAEEETVAKKSKAGSDLTKPSISLRTKKSQKKAKTSLGSASDLITFQSNAAVPTALFCRTPLSSKKKSQTPQSDSKKVTFGLKNNKTAEFRKTDRSLLVSPDGSSRVPFDPTQKPKFGVLKSPPTSLSARKTPKANRKSSLNTPKGMAKRRPLAADFF